MNMTPATMRRRLHEEGASYQSIKDQLRRDLAISYLSHSSRSVMDIALELGFSERSAFHRAFRKWTGASPGRISPHVAGAEEFAIRTEDLVTGLSIEDNCAMNLSGKVLVVTGSDGALGQAVAATLSGYGARLALLD